MTKKTIESRIEAYLAEHPQYVDKHELPFLQKLGCTVIEDKTRKYGKICTLYHSPDALVSPSWVVGGLTGGNCWGDSADQEVSAEEEPLWLEELMENIFPEISFLKFRRLQSKCIRYEYSDTEYYGNYTNKAFEVLRVRDLLEVLDA